MTQEQKDLNRYCTELSFRWNKRRDSDGECTVDAIGGIVGKRLFYKTLVGAMGVR